MFPKIKLSLYTASTLLMLAAVGISFTATANPPTATGFMGHVVAPARANQPTATAAVKGRAAARDVGPTVASNLITTSITLNMGAEKRQQLADFIQATVTPGDPQYHKFLTVEQFRQRFAPSSEKIQGLVAYLASHGIKVGSIDPDGLGFTATGSIVQFDGAFSIQIHDFIRNGQRFHQPAMKPVVPAQFADLLLSMPGLNSETGHYKPKNVRLGQGAYAKMPAPPRWHGLHGPGPLGNPTATGEPQYYSVGDVANFYQVNPFYVAKKKGGGRTVGVMTLANFSIPDAKAYWAGIGLVPKSTRTITKVAVDGGTPISCDCGNDETSLDVEQSGGLAPGANVVVYIAPNTDMGFNDVFKHAVNDNIADTVSISWGEPEVFYFPEFNSGTDYTGELVAIDQYLMQGAAQGQSIFAASGDSGAYDTARDAFLGGYGYDPLSVDYPSSDPYITAAGGTTVAADIPAPTGCSDINITSEQVWGWDYIYFDWGSCLGLTEEDLEFVGGGGGISVYWPMPNYQTYVGGIRTSFAGQTFDGFGVDYTFPAGFVGRNTPDLSLNADPETGYLVYDTLDFGGFTGGYGGTSFVAPQLNGITAVIDQAVGSRVGFLNPSIYLMQQLYGSGPPNPFNAVVNGDDWFFCGNYGCGYQYEYNNGPGIGSINAGDLALVFGWKPPYVVSSMLQQH